MLPFVQDNLGHADRPLIPFLKGLKTDLGVVVRQPFGHLLRTRVIDVLKVGASSGTL